MDWKEDLIITIHDCYYGITNKEPCEDLINVMFKTLPNDIKKLAEQWGGFDTEVREKTHEWILYLQMKEVYKNYSNPGVYEINWSGKLEDKEIDRLSYEDLCVLEEIDNE